MGRIIFQEIHKNIIYYGVYDTQMEVFNENEILCSVRKQFFEKGVSQKGRGNIKTDNELYHYSYVMENGVSLRYRKLKKDGKQLERVFDTAGGYFVETLNDKHCPLKKAYFDKQHKWIKTEFINPVDKRIRYTIKPARDGDRPLLVVSQGDSHTVLYAFNMEYDEEIIRKLNELAGTPPIFCITSYGNFYYCTEEAYQQRKAILENMPSDELYPSTEVYVADDLENISQPYSAVQETDDIIPAAADVMQTIFPEHLTETVTVSDNVRQTEEMPVQSEEDNRVLTVEQGGIYENHERKCEFSQECPYETVHKQIIESGGRQYFYFGDLDGDRRHGKGRTVMKTGETAYEGQYVDDKREGMGVYYYKSGRLCYAGNWKQNQKDGLGVGFSPTDGSAFIGEWQENRSVNMGAFFNSQGKLLYIGNVDNGIKNGVGITYDEPQKAFFVGKYRDGEFLQCGTEFDSEGNLLYTGGYQEQHRNGYGTSYRADGTVEYQGMWLNGLYDGEGTLYMAGGGTLKGTFRQGKANGTGTLTDKQGKIIYTGSFAEDIYNGTGRLFSDDGGYAEGRFVDGEPTGIFNEYTPDKKLLYSGEWTDMHRNGKGIEYQDGEKIYEGEFKNSLYDGEGKQLYNGNVIYIGSFTDGKRNGYGVELWDGDAYYQGMWKNGLYDGSGILFDNGEVRYIGIFKEGRCHGRVNEIADGRIIRKCLYEQGELVYMCEYSEDGRPIYWGSVSDGMYNGMGCTFGKSYEKTFEGIFRSNAPEKPMKVFLRELEEIPPCDYLADTEYELYRKAPEIVVDKEIDTGHGKGIYTGSMKDNLPDGEGTMLYSDHRYTGTFVQGRPDGKGKIYMGDGTEKQGIFSTEPIPNGIPLTFSAISYYYSISN